MNYISQINGFWKIAEDKQFSSSEIATYFALLNYCNNLNWLNPFVCHFEYVCQTASISKNTFYACMEKLHNEKLIEYTKGVKNSKKPKVFILNLENKTKNKTGIKLRTEEEQNEEQKGNLYKLLNNETIKPINKEQLFNRFWIDYQYKIGKDKTLKIWNKLTIDEMNKCLKVISTYVQSTPDKKYRKHPATYLNGKHWEDELNVPSPPKKQGFEYPPLPSPPVDFTLGY